MVPAKDRRAPCLEAKFKVRGVWGSEKAVLRETAPSFTNKTSNSHLHSFRFPPPPFTTTTKPFLDLCIRCSSSAPHKWLTSVRLCLPSLPTAAGERALVTLLQIVLARHSSANQHILTMAHLKATKARRRCRKSLELKATTTTTSTLRNNP